MNDLLLEELERTTDQAQQTVREARQLRVLARTQLHVYQEQRQAIKLEHLKLRKMLQEQQVLLATASRLLRRPM